MVFQQCAAGYYNPSYGSNSSLARVACTAGTSNPVPEASSSLHAPIACPDPSRPTAPPNARAAYLESILICLGRHHAKTAQRAISASRGAPRRSRAPGGKHANQTVIDAQGFLGSLGDCVTCGSGTYCPVGSATPTDCAAGTFNPNASAESCRPCVGGEYQDVQGSTSCKACSGGFYCPQGASAELPCPAGRYSNLPNLDEPTDCTLCDAGSSCATGSTEPTPCAPGTYTATTGHSECRPCEGGTYQDESGATYCKNCTSGNFCPEGAAAQLPCLAGSYSNEPNPRSRRQLYCMPHRLGVLDRLEGTYSLRSRHLQSEYQAGRLPEMCRGKLPGRRGRDDV